MLALAVGLVLARIPADNRMFADSSVWNERLADDAPLSPMSAAYVKDLRRQMGIAGSTINTDQFSVPIYTVDEQQALVPVRLVDDAGNAVPTTGDGTAETLSRAFAAGVPIPPDARAAKGTDQHMAVWQPSTDTLWEFWLMRPDQDGVWIARWGGKMTNVSENPGYFTEPHPSWGATASSLALPAGVMRIKDLTDGEVDHALSMAIPEPKESQSFVWPAQRSDGFLESADAIPEGTRFRLPADLDLEALGLPRSTLILARAAQRHGIIVRDKSGAVVLYGEAPQPAAGDPYAKLFADHTLQLFPWDRLQVVAPPRGRE